MTPLCPPPEEWEFYRLHGIWHIGPEAEQRYAQARAEKLADWPMPQPPPFQADDEALEEPNDA